MEDEDLIVSKPRDPVIEKVQNLDLEDVPNPEIVSPPTEKDTPMAEPPPADVIKRGPGRPRKVAKMADLPKFSEEALLDHAEELTENLYSSLGEILINLPKYENPNPKFLSLAAELLGLIKTPSGISITHNNINNSGNTTLLHASGGSFEQIAKRYHEREKLGLSDEFAKRLTDGSDIIDAEVVQDDGQPDS